MTTEEDTTIIDAGKGKRKFGLAWLFSFDEEEAPDDKNAAKVVDIDERIRGTWMTLEASKKERRVEAASNEFSRWEPINWHDNDNDDDNCTAPLLPQGMEMTSESTNEEDELGYSTTKYIFAWHSV